MSLSWYWPLARRGNAGGRQDLGIDDFGDDPLGNLAREVIQNSLDARKGQEPVKVEFTLFKTEASAFRALEDYLFNYVQDWLERDKKKEKPEIKERALMEKIFQAFIKSQSKGITWLRISDKNTKGLCGVSSPMERQMPWFAFINGSGKDVKEDGSGGSKGLGKAAIFLNSAVRTIFVSTSTVLGEKGYIGYARLVAKDVDDDGRGFRDWTQGIGYCVEEEIKNQELNTPNHGLLNDIDPNYSRDENEYGTDIYVPFFLAEEEKWASKMMGEAILSFLPAINDGDLEITINDPTHTDYLEVSKSNLFMAIKNPINFEKDSSMQAAQELYKTLNHPYATVVRNAGEGRELNILISLNSSTALNKVFPYRWKTKMRIEVFKTNSSIPYTAIILIKGNELCDELKSVENAAHNKWSKKKYRDTNYSKETISAAIDSVKDFAEQELEKLEDGDYGQSSDFEWANDEGWNSDASSDTLDGTANEDLGLPTEEIVFEPVKVRETPRKKKPKKPKATLQDPEGEAEGFTEGKGVENEKGNMIGSHPEGHNNDDFNHPHPGPNEVNVFEDEENGQKMMLRKPVSTISSKMPARNVSEGLFELFFSPSKSGEDVEIEILKSGSGDENEPITILEAILDGQELETKENKIYMPSMKKGILYRIKLKLKEHRIYVWEVNVNANE